MADAHLQTWLAFLEVMADRMEEELGGAKPAPIVSSSTGPPDEQRE